MTADVLDREAGYNWHAHAHVDIFRGVDEREARHLLFPKRAAIAERLHKRGLIDLSDSSTYERLPGFLVPPHITGEMLKSLGADVVGQRDEEGNLLANAGINRMGLLAFGAGTGQIYNTANSAIGAGDTNTAAAASQTDLSAAVNAANRYVQVVDSQPAFASQVLTMVATFATGNGNFAWAEWAIGQNTSSGANAMTAALLNRKVAALGTKTSAAAWAFTVTITFS